jgi:hypothetical protein
MNDVQIRAYVADLYKSPRWVARVNHMSDAQVYAIYVKAQAKLEEVKDKEKEPQDEIPF